jgi:hypothetical protein
VADNVAITAGSGTTVAADEVVDGTLGTVKVQYLKIMDGTLDGTAKATVKAASTAAVAGDPALVTTPSPNGIHVVQGLQSANTVGSITTAATVVGPLAVSGYNVVTVAIFGTYAGVSCVFEASPDNTNWFTVQGSRVDNGLLATGLTAATNTTMAVDIPIGVFTQFRVRATAFTSGSASVIMAAQSMPYDPCPATIPQQATAANLNATVVQATGTNLHTVVDSGTITTVSTVTAVTGITNALPAGANLLGRSVADASAATGGIATTTRLASAAATTNAANAKASAGRLYSAQGKNNAAYDVFLVLYDLAVSPTVGTSTIRKKIVCPAGQAFAYDWPLGLSFSTGIGYAFTKLVADADTTALVAADVTAFNLDYV